MIGAGHRDGRPPAPDAATTATAVAAHPAGRRGTLRTATGRELPVQGFERDEEVVLVVLADLGGPLPAEALDPVTLEYTSLRGVIRLHGNARFEDRSLMRFRAAGDPEVIQRRAFVRVHTPQQVSLGPTLAGRAAATQTIDISGGGMLLSGGRSLALGESLAFEMRLGDDPGPIEGTARVVRIDGDGRRAVAFEDIREGDRQRLIRFVFACLRSARAKTRGDLV
jgi:hypothetical protein